MNSMELLLVMMGNHLVHSLPKLVQ